MQSANRPRLLPLVAALLLVVVGCAYAAHLGPFAARQTGGSPPGLTFRPWLEKAPDFTAGIHKSRSTLAFPKDCTGTWTWLLFASKG